MHASTFPTGKLSARSRASLRCASRSPAICAIRSAPENRRRSRTHRRSGQEHLQAHTRAQPGRSIQLTRSVERMGRLAGSHLKQVLDAYTQRNVDLGIGVWYRDEEIDAYYNSLFRELLTYMMEDPRTISPCAHLLFIAKNIERIGDHCTNIARRFITWSPARKCRRTVRRQTKQNGLRCEPRRPCSGCRGRRSAERRA